MPVPNPRCEVVKLDYETQKSLLAHLDVNGAWKLIAEASGVLSPTDILRLANKSNSPSRDLIVELESKLFTVGALCRLLEHCKLYHILALLKDREPATITKHPGDVLVSGDSATLDVPLGGVLLLECEAKGLPPPQYIWYHENTQVSGQEMGKMCIKDFKHADEGEYYCCVRQTWNEETSEVYSTAVNVRALPEPPCIIEQPASSILCREGDLVTIRCVVRGYPKPEFQWFYKNMMLEGQTANVLQIRSVEISHNGEYRCYIKNEAGEIWTNITQVNAYKYSNDIGKRPLHRHEATEKIALLIANSTYLDSQSLKCPANDVIILANKLSQLGFKVIALENLTLIEMKNAVKKCCQLLPEGAYVLFYFAGHGFEMQDKFMLPVNAPGPASYLRSDSLCEKQVIRDVLNTKPQLFVILLDMCLRVPDIAENPHIHTELPEVFQYTSERNLIQGYATTSNLGAYEQEREANGIYVKHLEQLILNDVPIIKILEEVGYKVSVDTTDVAEKQMPSHSANVVENFYLNDALVGNEKTEAGFRDLNRLPPDTDLVFQEVNIVAMVKVCPVECFQNALEIRIRNVDNWIVSCATDCKVLKEPELQRKEIENVNYLITKIRNLQKLRRPLTLTFSLHDRKTRSLMDNTTLELGLPLIASAQLWFDKPDQT